MGPSSLSLLLKGSAFYWGRPLCSGAKHCSQAPLANIKALMTMRPPFRCNRPVFKPRSCGLNGLTWKPRTLGNSIRHSKGKLHDQMTWPKENNCPHLVKCKLDQPVARSLAGTAVPSLCQKGSGHDGIDCESTLDCSASACKIVLSLCACPKGGVMTRKGVRSACTVFAIAAPERAELSYEKNFTLDSEYKLMVIDLSSSPI